jgi:hypothetical protein
VAGHHNPTTFGRYYNGRINRADNQANFHKGVPRDDIARDLRSVLRHRHPRLHQSLPTLQQFELNENPAIIDIDKQLEGLVREISNNPHADKLLRRRQALYEQRRKVTVGALRAFQKNHSSKALLGPTKGKPTESALPECKEGECQEEQSTTLPSRQQPMEDPRRTQFALIRALAPELMPERDRLATSLFERSSLRSPEGVRMLRDMIALCKPDPPMAYRTGLQPDKNGCCAWCAKNMEEYKLVSSCYKAIIG